MTCSQNWIERINSQATFTYLSWTKQGTMFYHWCLCKTVFPQSDLIIRKANCNILTQPKANDSQKVYLHLSYLSLCLALAHPDVPCQTELITEMRTNCEKCTVRCQHWSAENGLLIFIFPVKHSFGTLAAHKRTKNIDFPQDSHWFVHWIFFTEIYENVPQVISNVFKISLARGKRW